MRILNSFIFSLSFITAIHTTTKPQITAAGDIAFTGYIAQDKTVKDQFSFVFLKAVTANTVIKFTDFGWRPHLSAFTNRNGNLESELTFTTNAAFNAGTAIVKLFTWRTPIYYCLKQVP